MYEFIRIHAKDRVAVLTLHRPEVLNAWHRPMRLELVDALEAVNRGDHYRAVVVTGAGNRAFSAGQDLNEAKTFDPDRAAEWMDEWRALFGAVRALDKPIVAAVNGVAAGSAFQLALLADVRVGHGGSRMGQPEINAGIPSTTGPWIMRELLGLGRTIELTLTGRLMDGHECHRIGLIQHLVAEDQVMPVALEVAELLASKPPMAMRLDKQRFREMTQAGFDDALDAGVRLQRIAYASGETQRMMHMFLDERARRRTN